MAKNHNNIINCCEEGQPHWCLGSRFQTLVWIFLFTQHFWAWQRKQKLQKSVWTGAGFANGNLFSSVDPWYQHLGFNRCQKVSLNFTFMQFKVYQDLRALLNVSVKLHLPLDGAWIVFPEGQLNTNIIAALWILSLCLIRFWLSAKHWMINDFISAEWLLFSYRSFL